MNDNVTEYLAEFGVSSEMKSKALPLDLHRSFYDAMVPTAWLIKAIIHSTADTCTDPNRHRAATANVPIHTDYQIRFVGGVCIGSVGLVVTVTASIKPNLSEQQEVIGVEFVGRRHNEDFHSLELVMEDEESGLSIFKVKRENGGPYNYVRVDDRSLVDIGRQLLYMDCSSPFSMTQVTIPLGTSTFSEMAEEPHELAKSIGKTSPSRLYSVKMARKYLPLQGVDHVQVEHNHFAWISQSGSPIFDSGGSLVGLMCMADSSQKSSIAYAVPAQTITQCIQSYNRNYHLGTI